jgi:ribosomal protein S20
LEELLQEAYKQIDKASKKTVNVISENKAARIKSKLARKIS